MKQLMMLNLIQFMADMMDTSTEVSLSNILTKSEFDETETQHLLACLQQSNYIQVDQNTISLTNKGLTAITQL